MTPRRRRRRRYFISHGLPGNRVAEHFLWRFHIERLIRPLCRRPDAPPKGTDIWHGGRPSAAGVATPRIETGDSRPALHLMAAFIAFIAKDDRVILS